MLKEKEEAEPKPAGGRTDSATWHATGGVTRLASHDTIWRSNTQVQSYKHHTRLAYLLVE
jgi:hypothetical protein